MIATVAARLRLPGFHHYPGASVDSPQRGYLEDRHRHLFGLRAELQVGHTNREVEFHDLSDRIRVWWHSHSDYDGVVEWGAASCEHIAIALHNHLDALGYTVHSITVDEDGEHEATIYPEH